MESSRCPFLWLNAKQGIEPRSNVLVKDARSLIAANIFFFIQQNLRYLIATTTPLIGHKLCFFVTKAEKNSRLNYQNDNTTRGGVEDTRLEAKDTKKIQGQEQPF